MEGALQFVSGLTSAAGERDGGPCGVADRGIGSAIDPCRDPGGDAGFISHGI